MPALDSGSEIFPSVAPSPDEIEGQSVTSAVVLRGEPALGEFTEYQWRACIDLEQLLACPHPRRSERLLRLFACACSRRIWHLLTDDRSRAAVEAVERYADDEVLREQVIAARNAAWRAPEGRASAVAVWTARAGEAWQPELIASSAAQAALAAREAAGREEEAFQCDLLRDLLGNPFRPVAIQPAWLQWQESSVRRLAEGIYKERDFKRLPVLGELLANAGCADPEILEHCFSSGEHARGCWVIDLVLGKA